MITQGYRGLTDDLEKALRAAFKASSRIFRAYLRRALEARSIEDTGLTDVG